jgi:hypothetical protein
MGNGRELGSVTCSIVVEFEKGNGEKLHIFRDAEYFCNVVSKGVYKIWGIQRTAARKLDEVELLTLLRPGNMRRDERIHECFKVGPPPLRQRVANLPLVVYTLASELCADWCKALIQPRLEALDLVVFGAEVVARSIKC